MLLLGQLGLVVAIGTIDRVKHQECIKSLASWQPYVPKISEWRGAPCTADRFPMVEAVFASQKELVIQKALDKTCPGGGAVAIKMGSDRDLARAEECFYYSVEPSPHIPEYYCSYLYEGNVYHVMELIDGADLLAHMERSDAQREVLAKILLRDIGPLVQSFYDQGFVHRDLKPDNVMLKADTMTMVLLDYEFAAFVDEEPLRGSCTPRYTAPELLDRLVSRQTPVPVYWEPFRNCDFWALGATLKSMLDAQIPHAELEEYTASLFCAIVNGPCIDKTSREHPCFREILEGLLEPIPEQRKTISELQPYISNLVGSIGQEEQADLIES